MDDLRDYIRTCLEEGHKTSEIRKRLLDSGWDEEDIESAMRKARFTTPKALLIGGLVFLALFSGAFLILGGEENQVERPAVINDTNQTSVEAGVNDTEECEDDCFTQKVIDCIPTNRTFEEGPLVIERRILGENGTNCLMSITYLEAPEGYVDKSMTCAIPKGRRDDYENYLKGSRVVLQCEGSLADKLEESRRPVMEGMTSARGCSLERGFICPELGIEKTKGFVVFTIYNDLDETITSAELTIRDPVYQCPTSNWVAEANATMPGEELFSVSYSCDSIRHSYEANLEIEYTLEGESVQRTSEGRISG